VAPQTPTASSSRKGAEGTVLVSSLVVVSLYAYRKLIEPATVGKETREPALRKIIGAEPTPATVEQFAVSFGFVFFSLSVAAMAAPELASAFAILVAVGYTLSNGASVFQDITRQVTTTTTPAPSSSSRPGQASPSAGKP
jgi:hypothetical protein